MSRHEVISLIDTGGDVLTQPVAIVLQLEKSLFFKISPDPKHVAAVNILVG